MTAQGRAAQRAWLLEHFPADVDVCFLHGVSAEVHVGCVRLEPACRCYRCGKLLALNAAGAIWPDKVDPNGTTRRSNLRPACRDCVGLTPPRPMTDAQLAEATCSHRRQEQL